MPVDTSFYKTPDPVNPLKTAGEIVGVGKGIQENKLLHTQNRAAELGVDAKEIELFNSKLDAMSKVLTPLAAQGAVTRKDMIGGMSTLIANGVMTAQEAAKEIQNFPQENTPEANAKYVQQKALSVLDAKQRLDMLVGMPQMINQGSQVTPVSVSPITGTHQIGNPLAMGVSPQYMNTGGGNMLVGGGNTPGYVPSSLPPTTPVYDQTGQARYAGDVPQGNPLAPNLGVGGDPINPAEKVLPSARLAAPPPGVAEASAKSGERSASSLADLRDSVQGSAPRLFQLQESLKALGNTNTGLGTEGRNNVMSFLNAVPGIKEFVPDFDIANYDKANKYLTQYAMGQSAALGQGTDSKLATALTGNASTRISNLAAKDIVKAAIGLEKMQQAQADVFEQAGLPDTDFNKWKVQWNKTIDPRAFVFDQMDDKAQAKMVKGMTGNEADRFAKSYNYAVTNGYVEER